MGPAAIDILMSTYCGEKYVGEQIDSLLGQTFSDWRLLVRDDGSTDATPEIVRGYVERHPGRILFVEGGVNVGAGESFSRLGQQSTARHVMYCDQDDVWLPEKIAISHRKIVKMENRFGKGIPILVFTDMKIVDESLNVVDDSFREYAGLFPRNATFGKLLLRNVASGCSMIVNRALLNLALPFPPGIVMHDYWQMLAAAALGKIGWSDEKTVLYRQHPGNALGIRPNTPPSLFSVLYSLAWDIALRRSRWSGNLRPYLRQAEAFAGVFGERLGCREKNTIRDFLRLDRCSYFARISIILRHRILPFDAGNNIQFLLAP
ncbi:MAG: putative glycosyltransferase [Actinobacteria bacterium]|nr:putative glycosyltransferase [Actinomycetota bacterium]